MQYHGRSPSLELSADRLSLCSPTAKTAGVHSCVVTRTARICLGWILRPFLSSFLEIRYLRRGSSREEGLILAHGQRMQPPVVGRTKGRVASSCSS